MSKEESIVKSIQEHINKGFSLDREQLAKDIHKLADGIENGTIHVVKAGLTVNKEFDYYPRAILDMEFNEVKEQLDG